MAFQYTIAEIAEMCVAGIAGDRKETSARISQVITDSRTNVIPQVCLFFALRGERHDGHHYIKELAERGVTLFVVEAVPDLPPGISENLTFLIVKNTLVALQSFATKHRQRFNLPVAAITGSNGKTIVKEWLAQLLAPEYKTVRSPLSYNSQVGVPLSVLQLDKPHEMAIFEAGISAPGEMANLERIIQPTLGLFTGIGPAHDENFSGRDQKVNEKLNLFINCKDLIAFNDSELMAGTLQPFAKRHNIRLFTIGNSNSCDLQVISITPNANHVEIQAAHDDTTFSLTSPFSDEASVKNTLLCLATMLFLGYKPEVAAGRILSLEPVAMRMQQIEGIQNCILINDSYNNDLMALEMALDHLRHNNARPGKCIILSDIFQSGLEPDEMTLKLSELINRYQPAKFVGIGNTMASLKGKLQCQTWFYRTTADFIRYHPLSGFHDEVILLKGARSFQFEQIRDVLQRQSHGTVLEINLGALVHNLNYYRSKLSQGTRVMAMVKAAAYGGGDFEIASVLQYQKVDYLAVAYTDEGVELRKAGVRIPVMVMNPEPSGFDTMIDNMLEPEIYSFKILKAFTEALTLKLPANAPPYPVHIEVDTGMHRLGFDPGEITNLIKILNQNRVLKVASLFSHLATAEEKRDVSFARHQIAVFEEIRNKFKIHFINSQPLFHILNSAGIINFPDAQYDMVRPGLGLYGVAADPDVQKQLMHVGCLKSVVSQIRRVEKGDSVGYNRAFVADREMIIATVAIGYADGFNRKLGNGTGKVRVMGEMVPVIGDVCMDMIMIDITSVADVKEGDEVVIFDSNYPISNIANLLETIPYEVLTGISSRVKRIYLTE